VCDELISWPLTFYILPITHIWRLAPFLAHIWRLAPFLARHSFG